MVCNVVVPDLRIREVIWFTSWCEWKLKSPKTYYGKLETTIIFIEGISNAPLTRLNNLRQRHNTRQYLIMILFI